MAGLGLLQLQVEYYAEDGELTDVHIVVAGQQARGTNLPQLHLLG